jgi:hypothetical protein
VNELSPASFTRLQFRWSASYRALLKPPLTSTAPQSRIETVGERMFEQSRSLAGRIKGLCYAVRLNDFKLAHRLRLVLRVRLGPRSSRRVDGPISSPAVDP